MQDEQVKVSPSTSQHRENVYDPVVTTFPTPDHLKKEDEQPGFFDVLPTALNSESSIAGISRVLTDAGFSYDRFFNLEETLREDKELSDRIEALPLEFEYGSAMSRKHLDYLVQRAEDELERDKYVAQAEGWGALASFTAATLDPTDWALSLLSGPIGLVSKGTKMQRVLRSGVSAAAINASVESFVVSGSSFRGNEHIVYAGLLGLSLGSGLGYLAPKDNAAFIEAAKRLAADERGAIPLSRKAKPPQADEAPTTGTRTQSEGLEAHPESDDLALASFHLPTYAKQVIGSASSRARKMGLDLLEAGPLKNKDSVRQHSAELEADLIERKHLTTYYKSSNPFYKAWAKENGYRGISAEFNSAPGEVFRRRIGEYLHGADEADENVIKAADQFSTMMRNMLEEQKAAGVLGAENIPFNKNYLPRVPRLKKVREVLSEVNLEGLAQIIRRGLDPEMPENVATRVSKAYARRLSAKSHRVDMEDFHGVSFDDMESLRLWFDDDKLFSEVEEALTAIKKSKGDTNDGRPSWLKKRLFMDMTAETEVGGKTYRVMDLFDQDVGRVGTRYVRSAAGWSALAKKGYRSQSDVNKALEDIRSQGDVTAAKKLDEVVNLITGRSIDTDPYSSFNQVSKSLRDLNFVTKMGQAGWFGQMAELGFVAGKVGLKNMLANMPGLKALWRRARKGELEDDLAEELHFVLGSGSDFVRNPVMRGFDDLGIGFDTTTRLGQGLEKADNVLQGMKRFVSIAGGLAPVTAWMQGIAAKSIAHKLSLFASGRKLLTDAQRVRLRDAGWSDKMQERIFEEMRKHSKFSPSGRLKAINYQSWDDEVFGSFSLGMNRLQRIAVQENDIGSTIPFMHKELGKVLTQFRSFAVNAYSKQFLHNVHFRDMETFMVFSMGLMSSSLAYIGQQTANNWMDGEKLEDRLSLDNIVKGSLQKHGMLTLFPGLVDTAMQLTGFDPVFKYGRSSGQAASFIAGNPTVSTINNLGKLASLPGSLAHPSYNFSQEDSRVLEALLPNIVPVKNGIEMMNQNLPKHSQEDEYWN